MYPTPREDKESLILVDSQLKDNKATKSIKKKKIMILIGFLFELSIARGSLSNVVRKWFGAVS